MVYSTTMIEGIKFFDNASACIAEYKNAHWTYKAISIIQNLGTFFQLLVYRSSLFLRKVEVKMTPYTIANNISKQKLVVCLHGLNSNPTQFKTLIDDLNLHDLSGTNIYVPKILEKGNAKLDDMIRPIFEVISKWAKTEGEKELVLIGTSNGGRIARAVEAELTKSGNFGNIKKLKFVSIVGACKGSSLANFAHKAGLSCLMKKNIAEEMPTNSKRSVQLNLDWETGLKMSSEIVRDYTFIASPHDWHVPNFDSTLVTVPNYPARYAIVKGHGHSSIVEASTKAIKNIILNKL